MARVFFSGELRRYAGACREVEIRASTYRELVAELDARFPGIAQVLRDNVAVAIDGEIINDPFVDAIEADSEVHFLARIAGG